LHGLLLPLIVMLADFNQYHWNTQFNVCFWSETYGKAKNLARQLIFVLSILNRINKSRIYLSVRLLKSRVCSIWAQKNCARHFGIMQTREILKIYR